MAKKEHFMCKKCDEGGPYPKMESLYRHLRQAHSIAKVKVKPHHYYMTNQPCKPSTYRPKAKVATSAENNSSETGSNLLCCCPNKDDKNKECGFIYGKKQALSMHLWRTHKIKGAVEDKHWKHTTRQINTTPSPTSSGNSVKKSKGTPGRKPGQVVQSQQLQQESLAIPLMLIIPLKVGVPYIEESDIETQTITAPPYRKK
jgi:hypothetical protein